MPYPARFYAAFHRGTPGDLEHYRRICHGASSVLELGCGYGRIVTALAAPGRCVVGVDRDPALLALAEASVRALPPDARAGVELHEGDMRHVDLGRRFDRVLVPFGGLYCLLDDAEVHAALATVVRHLAPGGRVGLDVYRADEFHEEAEPEDVPDDAYTPLGRVEVDGVAYEVLERSAWDKARQRLDVHYLHVDETGRAIEGTIAQRYLLEDQLRAALARAGLTITRLDTGFSPRRASEGVGEKSDPSDDGDEADALMVVEAIASP